MWHEGSHAHPSPESGGAITVASTCDAPTHTALMVTLTVAFTQLPVTVTLRVAFTQLPVTVILTVAFTQLPVTVSFAQLRLHLLFRVTVTFNVTDAITQPSWLHVQLLVHSCPVTCTVACTQLPVELPPPATHLHTPSTVN